MNKNSVLSKGIHSLKNSKKNGGLNIEEQKIINNFINITDNKKRIINLKISEEEKNLEYSLQKIKNNILKTQNITLLRNDNEDFYEKYNDFSKTHLKTIEVLVQDLTEKYKDKGYPIPNLHYNLFKINPLLEDSSNRIFLSYLYDPIRTKFNKRDYMNINKSILYMKKLSNIISPETNTKGKKRKSINKNNINKKLLKIKLKEKEKEKKKAENKNQTLTNRINELIKRLNYNGLNDMKNHSFIKERNNSISVSDKSNKFYNSQKFNIKLLNEISSKKSTNNRYNSDLLLNKKLNKKKLSLSNFFKNKKKNDSIFSNTYKTVNSTKKFEISNLKRLSEIEPYSKISNKENDSIFLKTERIKNNSKKYILKTPKILKNNVSIEKSNNNNNTKAISITNENSSLTYRTKMENSKSKTPSFFKVKEFTINSNKNNESNEKMNKCSSSNRITKIEKYKKEKILPLEFRISTPKKVFETIDDKEKFLENMYKSFNLDEFKDTEKKLKLYLSQTRKLDEKEIDQIMSKYSHQNFKLNLLELKKIINEKKIAKKSFHLYINNHDYNRIEHLLKSLNEKEKNIMKLDKRITKAFINS